MAQDPVRWLYDLQHFGIKLGLENIRTLLEWCGSPQRAFRTVLVGGTNGKGSVASMLASMLEAHGIKSGLFTSPHLVRPNERIRIGGEDISTEALHERLNGMRRMIEEACADGRMEFHPSFFEVMTATALTAFRDAEVQAGILEVGLGGRLDATNAVEADLSVIVSVDFDHMKTLGRSLLLIAAEKAGIIKQGRPVLSGIERLDALGVIRGVARRRGAPVLESRESVQLHEEPGGTFALETSAARYDRLSLGLDGRHQRQNARLALLALETLLERMGRGADPEQVRHGLASVRWAGRLQWLEPEGGPEMLFDGAHNVAGVEALGEYLDGLQRPRPVMLFGAMRGKKIPEILERLRPRISKLVITRPGVNRSLEPEEIAEVARRVGIPCECVEEPARAFERARGLAAEGSEPGGYLLVAGSLYLVGQVLAMLEPEEAPGPVSM
ncbi:hypothetical protein ABI59_13135 [Acidobacteria bacterium Mor1]|nr:hypothetical protein ABI59_13135 [Acidobacteria bacterium Mor1]